MFTTKHSHILTLAAGLLVGASVFAVAQQGTPAPGFPQGNTGPSSMAFMMSMQMMNTAMNVSMTGDADKDFARTMIPHHQGAIDMAKVELQYGKDPMLRQMAQGIIDGQTKEIGDMNKWLSDHK